MVISSVKVSTGSIQLERCRSYASSTSQKRGETGKMLKMINLERDSKQGPLIESRDREKMRTF